MSYSLQNNSQIHRKKNWLQYIEYFTLKLLEYCVITLSRNINAELIHF